MINFRNPTLAATRTQVSKPIAILTDQYADYQKVFVEGIAKRLNANGFECICVTGGQLNDADGSKPWLSAANCVYTLLDANAVSGIILIGGTLSHGAAKETLNKFVQQYQLPLVSLGLQVPGIPSVIVDDVVGMNSLMSHVLNRRGARQFAFIRGYHNDPYSALREKVFTASLVAANIDADRTYFINGDYDDIVTYHEVVKLLSSNPAINTLVAANDLMAVSAVRAANAVGKMVPDDLIVTGFDDTFDALQCVPALTTVRQPLVEMAEKSADMMLSLLRDDCCEPMYVLNSRLVVRTSSQSSAGVHKATQHNLTLWQDTLTGLQVPFGVDVKALDDALLQSLRCRDGCFSFYALKNIAKIQSRGDLHWWLNVCFELEKHVLQQLHRQFSEDSCSRVGAEVTGLKERLWGLSLGYEADVSRSRAIQADLQHQTGSCNNLTDIVSSVRNWIKALRPNRCYLIRLSQTDSLLSDALEVLIQFEHGEFVSRESISKSEFALVPPLSNGNKVMSRTGNLVITPVTVGTTLRGYLAVDPSGVEIRNIAEITRCIGNGLQSVELLEQLESKTVQLQKMNEELSELANTDILTSLPNRRHFIDTLTHRSIGHRIAVLFIDLDGFKAINDQYGHDHGDRVLQEIAQRIQQACNERDILFESPCHSPDRDNLKLNTGAYRLGGDEFTIIVRRYHGIEELRLFAQQVIERIATPIQLHDLYLGLTASIGIAHELQGILSTDKLVRNADRAMYNAKTRGKNQVVIANVHDISDNRAA